MRIMAKKCIICDKNATYKVKDTPDYYCDECAEENFGDVSVLIKVEEEALRLKEFLKEKVAECLCEEEDCEHKKKKMKDDLEQNDESDD